MNRPEACALAGRGDHVVDRPANQLAAALRHKQPGQLVVAAGQVSLERTQLVAKDGLLCAERVLTRAIPALRPCPAHTVMQAPVYSDAVDAEPDELAGDPGSGWMSASARFNAAFVIGCFGIGFFTLCFRADAFGKRQCPLARQAQRVMREHGRLLYWQVTLREFASASIQAMCGRATIPRTKKDAHSGGGTSVHKNATGPERAIFPRGTREYGVGLS